VQIDEKCVELLALHQPTAKDLRFITTAMKIVTDLERIGDQAVNIAQRWIANTLFVFAGSVAVTLVAGVAAAYSLRRAAWRFGRGGRTSGSV
jgi:ABC-type glycerol-3-phosphate transport system permease component